MKMCGGVELYLHAFLTSALDESEWSSSRLGHFSPGTQWIRRLYPRKQHRVDGWIL